MNNLKSRCTLTILVLMTGICFAQQESPVGKWRFQSINNVGLLEGQAGSAFQLQTINGAAYHSWFAGLGIGLDYYKLRTIPFFLDFRKEFGQSNQKFFLYADGGISFSWVTNMQKLGYVDEQFSNGFYDDLGLGYKTVLGKNNALLLSLGYSFKKITDTYSTPYYGIDFPPTYPKEWVNYNLNRLTIKLGWSF
jgi:hypothetical protein